MTTAVVNGGAVVNGAGAGGGDLPAASTAGELLVSDGAGTDYTPTPRSDVVTDALVEMIGGEPEGSAIISDGAGDIRTVDANIAPFLAATSTADARDAIGVQDGPRVLALLAGTVSTTTSSGHDVIGYGYLDPTAYEITDRTTTLTIDATGLVVSGVTGTLVLYDITGAATAATLTWTETTVTRKTASVTVPGTARSYELRFSKSGGGASDYAFVGGVNLSITWS